MTDLTPKALASSKICCWTVVCPLAEAATTDAVDAAEEAAEEASFCCRRQTGVQCQPAPIVTAWGPKRQERVLTSLMATFPSFPFPRIRFHHPPTSADCTDSRHR